MTELAAAPNTFTIAWSRVRHGATVTGSATRSEFRSSAHVDVAAAPATLVERRAERIAVAATGVKADFACQGRVGNDGKHRGGTLVTDTRPSAETVASNGKADTVRGCQHYLRGRVGANNQAENSTYHPWSRWEAASGYLRSGWFEWLEPPPRGG